MSSANVDLVRSIFAEWERGDFSRDDWADPEIELVRPEALGDNVLKGRESSSGGWREWLNAWKDFRAEAHEYLSLDDEHVLVVGRMSGTGQAERTRADTEIWAKIWSDADWREEELIELPPNRVALDATLRLRGLRSSIWVEHRWWYVFEIRDSLILRNDGFQTKDEALAVLDRSASP